MPTNKEKETTTTVAESTGNETTTVHQKPKPVDPLLQPLIVEGTELWSALKPNILAIGRVVSKIKKTFVTKKRNPITGQVYTRAIAEMGMPYATAEFYRRMAETVDDPNKPIAQDVFLALYDSGVNLAAQRFSKAKVNLLVTNLNANNAEEVERVPKELTKQFPILKKAPVSFDKLATAIQEIKGTMENTETPTIKEALEEALEGKKADAVELMEEFRDKVTELVQMLGGEGYDDPQFTWAKAAQEELRARLITLKLA